MSEITRTEKFLRACIDGEPCALKPLTRVEKLLAELNETLAGGSSDVVILPETVLTGEGLQYALPAPPENTPTAGGTYKIVWDGVEHVSPALDVTETMGAGMPAFVFGDTSIMYGEEGAAAMGNPAPGAPFVLTLTPNGIVIEEGEPTIYGIFMATEETTNPTLSIVQTEGAASGGEESGLVATVTETNGTYTVDKPFSAVFAAFKAGHSVLIKTTPDEEGYIYLLHPQAYSEQGTETVLWLLQTGPYGSNTRYMFGNDGTVDIFRKVTD